jgi:hypothetical protein
MSVSSSFDQCKIQSEVHQSCGQPREQLMCLCLRLWKLLSPFSDPIRWRAPEMLIDSDQAMNAVDV